MKKELIKDLIDYLSEYVTENKSQKIDEVLAGRTRYLSVVLEDIFQTHNASAVVRSCECFGVQDLHIIEKRNQFSPMNSVAKGSAKWLDFYRYKTTSECFKDLKKSGYKIVATTPHKKSVDLHELPIDQKMVLVFGTEGEGLSKEAMNLADEYVTIPMVGFTESFNISVSVAICLYDITQRLRDLPVDWQLSQAEILDIKLNWLKKVVPGSDIHQKRFLEGKGA
ncbi:TrmH family RNA methyltransferase [Candidatus Dependentiae bacterium]